MHQAIPYRRDIDGLRAVAVLAVVAFHAAPEWVRGGFVGVDVFFVISGYLITSIILAEREGETFSFITFYARRIRRLYPALLVMLTALLAAGWYYLLPREFALLGRHTYMGAGYLINFRLANDAGYFDAAATLKPLLHLWSLAVEEQFYLVWPALLMFARSRKATLVALVGVLVTSFGLTLASTYGHSQGAFYLPQNRFWELALGALLAERRSVARAGGGGAGWAALSGRVADGASLAGAALIGAAVAFFSDQISYPGVPAVAPCLGAALLIGAGEGALVNRLVLARRGAVAIGLISYPLYLWHWPLLSVLHILKCDDGANRLAAVALAFVLAAATFRLIERPFRHAALLPSALGLLLVSAALAAAGFAMEAGRILPRLSDAQFLDITAASRDWAYPDGLQWQRTSAGIDIRTTALPPIDETGATGGAGRAILFAGDSNMEQYWPRVRTLLERAKTPPRVLFFTAGRCLPIEALVIDISPNCARFYERLRSLGEAPDVTSVVIAGNWYQTLVDLGAHLDGAERAPLRPGTPGWARAFQSLETLVRSFTGAGKRVTLIGNIPTSSSLEPLSGIARRLSGEVAVAAAPFDRAYFDRGYQPIRAALAAIAERTGALFIDPMAALCGAGDCPRTDASGRLIYYDRSHLRASFVAGQATFIDAALGATAP